MKITEGVYAHFIPTDKYKTNQIIFRMTGALDPKNLARRVLVSQMLATANKTYPTVQLFKEGLAKLYGAELSTRVSTKGLTHQVDVKLTYLKDSLLPEGQEIFESIIDFLKDCLYKPLSRVAQYQTKVFENEKKNLLTYLKSDKEDTYYYSDLKSKELYFVNPSLQISKYSNAELVEKENSYTAYQEFQSMLTQDQIDIFILGEVDEYKVLQQLHQFPLEARQTNLNFEYHQNYTNISKELIEQRKSNQSILQLAYHIPCKYGENEYFSLIVFNGFFGGFAHSRLFTEIREESGLAYAVGSQFDIFTGLLEVYAGIDKSNRDKVMKQITKELNYIKMGRFSSALIKQTKKILQTNALLAEDSPRTLIEQAYNHRIFGERCLDLDNWLTKINSVTKEDICKIANNIKLQSIFFLEGE
ncbi:EF-P 5-aminopentanol modification-associated protein YfmF [Streptococcus dentiloxodontae]